ncbi:DUF3888 domain-containing protein [Bacillus sp. Gen3]|nr:DUF3888 domain-containing protein [Bacillus sp. Gen3]
MIKLVFRLVIIFILVNSSLFPSYTSRVNAKNIDQTELENAFIDAVNPLIYEAITDFYKKEPVNISYMCQHLIDLNNIDKGSRFFDAVIQFITYQGAHNPPNHLFTIYIKRGVQGWQLISYKVDKNYNPKKYCR